MKDFLQVVVDWKAMCKPNSLFTLLLAPLCIVLFLVGSANADEVDDQIGKLKNSPEFKVRISAVLQLTKLADERAVKPFVAAMKDSDKTVRGVSAAGLGKIVSARTSAKMRSTVLAKLQRVAESDANDFVRNQALKAHGKVKALDSANTP